MTGGSGAAGFNAQVRVNEPDHVTQAARIQRAQDMTDAVAAVEQQIADVTADPRWREHRLAALHAAWKSATAEAEQARREAQEGAQ